MRIRPSYDVAIPSLRCTAQKEYSLELVVATVVGQITSQAETYGPAHERNRALPSDTQLARPFRAGSARFNIVEAECSK